jgi:hypothetical protein
MNKSVHEFSSLRVPTTFALVVSAGLAATPLAWPAPETARFNSLAPNESYSSFRRSVVHADQADQAKFEQRVSQIYAALAAQQIPLDHEIATIWDAHAEELYWS